VLATFYELTVEFFKNHFSFWFGTAKEKTFDLENSHREFFTSINSLTEYE